MTEQEIYKTAIEKFGVQAQSDMLIEECSELIQAVLKFRRKPMDADTLSNLHEEFADVKIMMAQIETTLDAEILLNWKERKLRRLEERLK